MGGSDCRGVHEDGWHWRLLEQHDQRELHRRARPRGREALLPGRSNGVRPRTRSRDDRSTGAGRGRGAQDVRFRHSRLVRARVCNKVKATLLFFKKKKKKKKKKK